MPGTGEEPFIDRPSLEKVIGLAFSKAHHGAVAAVASAGTEDTPHDLPPHADHVATVPGAVLGIEHVRPYFHVLDAFALPRVRYRAEERVWARCVSCRRAWS